MDMHNALYTPETGPPDEALKAALSRRVTFLANQVRLQMDNNEEALHELQALRDEGSKEARLELLSLEEHLSDKKNENR